jgi:hypothetical protein
MDERPNHVKLADLLSRVIVEFAKEEGISVREARRIFVSATTEFGRKLKDGTLEYDPHLDPSHPMHGWNR